MTSDPLTHLREVMDRLRSPGGCPWDGEQDHRSLLRYLIEEAYEFIDAVERDDRDEMVEELGDLLLQVYFHARIGEERESDPFNLDEIATRVAQKLISRHPHVFSGDPADRVESSEEVLGNWERIKNKEKSREDIFDGVPIGQPALTLATKYLQRAMKNSRQLPEGDRNSDDIGEALLALVRSAVEQGIDPESELRRATLKFAAGIDRRVEQDRI